MRTFAYVQILVLAILLGFASDTCALSCAVNNQTLDETLKSEFRKADLVAVGTFVQSSDTSQGNFAVEGIWKGPDFEVLDVGLYVPPPIGTRTAVYLYHGVVRDNSYTNIGLICIFHNFDIGYAELTSKTEELFGTPRKPDLFMPNFVFVSGLLLFFAALMGVSIVVIRQVTFNKSLNADTGDAGAS